MSFIQGDWPEPKLTRCAHSRKFPVGNDREDQCQNVAQFTVKAGPNPAAPVCGQCLAPVAVLLLRRYRSTGVLVESLLS